MQEGGFHGSGCGGQNPRVLARTHVARPEPGRTKGPSTEPKCWARSMAMVVVVVTGGGSYRGGRWRRGRNLGFCRCVHVLRLVRRLLQIQLEPITLIEVLGSPRAQWEAVVAGRVTTAGSTALHGDNTRIDSGDSNLAHLRPSQGFKPCCKGCNRLDKPSGSKIGLRRCDSGTHRGGTGACPVRVRTRCCPWGSSDLGNGSGFPRQN